MFSRNLFPHADQIGVVAGCRREPPDDFETAERGRFWTKGATAKSHNAGLLRSRNLQYQRQSRGLIRLPAGLHTVAFDICRNYEEYRDIRIQLADAALVHLAARNGTDTIFSLESTISSGTGCQEAEFFMSYMGPCNFASRTRVACACLAGTRI
jgi:hypothetical protein